MIIFAAILFAASSPLTSASDYIYAPFENVSNTVSFIKGKIIGSTPDYLAIRAEDIAFACEAMAERSHLAKVSSTNNVLTNVVKCLNIGWTNSNFNTFPVPGTDSKYYIQPDPPLIETESYPSRVGEEYIVFVSEPVEYVTNSITNTVWYRYGPNQYRTNWPDVVRIYNDIDLKYKPIRYEDRPITNNLRLIDCIMQGEDYHVATNIYGSVSNVQPIPTIGQITNIYNLSERSSRLLSTEPIIIATNSPLQNVYHNDHKDYVDLNFGVNPNYVWVDAGSTITNWGGGASAGPSYAHWSETFTVYTAGGVYVSGNSGDQHYELSDGGINNGRIWYTFDMQPIFDVKYVVPHPRLPEGDNCEHFKDARVYELWEIEVIGYDDQYDHPRDDNINDKTNVIVSLAGTDIQLSKTNVTVTVRRNPVSLASGAPQSMGVFFPGQLSGDGLRNPSLPSLDQDTLEEMWMDGRYDPTQRIIYESSYRYRTVTCRFIEAVVVLSTAFRTYPPGP